jgi:hypothetical protein
MPEPQEMIVRMEELTGRSADAWIEAMRAGGKAALRPLYDRQAAAIAALGDDIVPGPRGTYVGGAGGCRRRARGVAAGRLRCARVTVDPASGDHRRAHAVAVEHDEVGIEAF